MTSLLLSYLALEAVNLVVGIGPWIALNEARLVDRRKEWMTQGTPRDLRDGNANR